MGKLPASTIQFWEVTENPLRAVPGKLFRESRCTQLRGM